MTDSPDETDGSAESDAADGNEFELERAYDRAELAAVFREFATAFEAGRPLRLDGDDRTVRIDVPERVVAAFEAEHESDDEPPISELELELEWDDADGSSVRVTDRASTADSAEASAETDSTDADPTEAGAGTDSTTADPATAVLPLEGVADRDGGEDGVEASETADGESDGRSDQSSGSGRTSRFEVYEDRAGQWRWRLVHWNGNIVADSGEGYTSRSNAERAARSVMRSAPTARIRRLE